MSQANGGLEVAAFTSRLEGLEVHGNKYLAAQITPHGGQESRFMKLQASDRLRFKSWG